MLAVFYLVPLPLRDFVFSGLQPVTNCGSKHLGHQKKDSPFRTSSTYIYIYTHIIYMHR